MNLFGAREKGIIRICIDSQSGGVFAGRIVAPMLVGEERFSDAADMLLVIESYLDASGGPKAYQRGRTFGGHARTVEVTDEPSDAAHDARGQIATCALRVTTRQNSTWQGYADIGDEEGGVFFASALDLMFYIDGKLRK